MIRERIRPTRSPPRARRRGIRHRGGRCVDALVHRPDRRHAQLHPRRAAVRDAARGGARGRAPAGRDVGAGPRRALVGDRGRRGVGGIAARPRDGSPCRGVADLDDAQILYGSGRDSSAPGSRRGSTTCPRRSGGNAGSATSGGTRCSPRARRRAWSRSGCRPGMPPLRPSSSRRPAVAPPTSRAAARSISGTFLASNGRLHGAMLERLRPGAVSAVPTSD